MIHSVAHSTHPLHPAHIAHRRRHYRRTLGVAAVLFVATLLFAAVGFFTGVNWHELVGALIHSTYRLALAYGLALVVGLTVALVLGASRLSEALFPVFDVLQNVPSFALIPLFIYFFGYTDTMVVIFAATSIVWPILFATMSAIRSARIDLADAASIFGATGLRRLTSFYFPLAFPSVVTGSIVGVAIGWETVIGAELIGNLGGFGAFIKGASSAGITPPAVAGIAGILFIVFVINRLIWAPLLSENTHRLAE